MWMLGIMTKARAGKSILLGVSELKSCGFTVEDNKRCKKFII